MEDLGSFDRYGKPLPSCADIFEVDEVVRALYPRDADPGLLPLRVYGDGNCLFRSASLLFYSDGNRHLDLSLRTAAEVCMNSRHYTLKLPFNALVAVALLLCRQQRFCPLLCKETLKFFSLVFSKALEFCSSLQDAYFEAMQEEIKNTCSSGWYSSVLHILGLPTAVGTTINLIYPMHNEGIRPFVHTIINPMDVESGSDALINIMWSTTSKRNTISAWFEPNHFVFLYFL